MTYLQMSPRARYYLWVVAGRSAALALITFIWPSDLDMNLYRGVEDVLPISDHLVLTVWGVLFSIGAVWAALAAWLANITWARRALLYSVCVTGMWTGSMVVAIVSGNAVGWVGLIVWAALTTKDIVMLADPMRVPLEDVYRR